ncbi:YihY/virulence factor BrkB family protein [Anianabacter salinae]|uniref:YihY/virulence factor BrkB family protein n=1 Tax=Anianabacter salinae TaxID=2851023 RepID=UPI00225E6F9B|nr:YihY/virulence factor BrkB family protein [Anianabacter salinae]MBV0913683.1 YihY/virulence factor BrkB family protein [Anianabacter salinae]
MSPSHARHLFSEGYSIFIDRDLSLVAAGVAFYFMLSLFPAIAAIVALWGLLSDAEQVSEQMVLMQTILPAQIFDLLDMRVQQLVSADTGSLGFAGALTTLIAIVTARLGVAALMRALNTVYGGARRHGARQALVAIMITFTLISLGLVALASVVVAPIAVALLPLVPEAAWLVEVVRWAVAVAAMTLGLSILYRYGPNHDGARGAWLSYGSFFAFAAWLALSVGLSIYLSSFPRFSQIYGSIGAAVALMLWLYLSALVVLLGAVLNVVAARARNRGSFDEAPT